MLDQIFLQPVLGKEYRPFRQLPLSQNLFDHKQPKNNVLLIVAWLYSQYGVFPITTKEIKDIGNSTGLVIPGRPDNTMRTAKKKGKNLFNQHGKGWRLTVSGETYLREIYSVKKGNKPLDE